MGITKELMERKTVVVDLTDPNIVIKGILQFLDLETGRLTMQNYVILNEKNKIIGRGNATVIQDNNWKRIRQGEKNIIPNNWKR
jgi:hypothetical protein